jgi:hypothetical protein
MRPKKSTSTLELNDAQLAAVMAAAGTVSIEKRNLFLERVVAWLRLRGPRFTDANLGAAIRLALTGLKSAA